jgi:hypothetical protein
MVVIKGSTSNASNAGAGGQRLNPTRAKGGGGVHAVLDRIDVPHPAVVLAS